ncbi:MAG: flagellar export chaperone FliS [Candidatus Melainabacteria bacterium GWF2_37_15]|nr:MAG: flagellar export chaperone FliS [Candidatus Melainabacteria bacterium GWF2_37_15]
MNPYLKQYQQSQIQTASPEKILIMLYDGAIQFLNKALKAVDDNDIQESHNNIIGAQRIISEFMNTLDVEAGGDVCKNLYSLYEYLHYRLVQANIQKNKVMLEEVMHHLKELKETWEEAIRIASKEKDSSDVDLKADTEDIEEDDDDEDEENEDDGFVG